MKKIIVTVAAIVLALGMTGNAFAQKKAVNAALKSVNSGKLDAGVENIEAAIQNPETMSLSNTWVVRGDVYTAVASNPFFAKRYENPADKALESYQKAMELDPSDKMHTILALKLPNLAGAFYDLGTEAFSAGDFAAATVDFEKSLAVTMLMGDPDSASMFNIALCAANDNQLEKAAEFYGALVAAAYPMMGIYNGLADVYVRMDRKDEVAPLMDLLVERFETDSTAYVTAVGILLNIGDNEHSEVILAKAVEKWPTDPFLYLAMGVAYENSKQAEKAEEAYKKALELNPEYPEAIYNLGAFYVNQGIDIQNQARNLPLDATAEYDALSAQANALFQQSIPYLEKIVEAQPNNVDALNTLRGIYIQLNQMDKANEIKARVDALTGAAE